MMREKFAVLSIDVEDWYHTGYFRQAECAEGYSMLDGLDRFADILAQRGMRGELFVLADLLNLYPERFLALQQAGHVISSHGRSHIPPLHLSTDQFERELAECIEIHQHVLGTSPEGFRAARFMIDRPRLDCVHKAGFLYDSSLIDRRQHAGFDWRGFLPVSKHILQLNNFFEFRPATYHVLGARWPIAGGGAMRILPWWLTALPLRLKAPKLDLYSFYIHPIDISNQEQPPLPKGTSRFTKARMQWGRASMPEKLERLIDKLSEEGFQFNTYRELRARLTSHQSPQPQNVLPPVRVSGRPR